MIPYYEDVSLRLHHADCMDALAELPDCSVDSVVTDPPYGLGFMGKQWDALPPGVEWAAECLRVLKPGGYLLAFGGSRTWHRLAVAVEDAGFETEAAKQWREHRRLPHRQPGGQEAPGDAYLPTVRPWLAEQGHPRR